MSEEELTTIQVDKETRDFLESKKRGKEGIYKVVRRLVQGISDVYVEFVLIDNELPRTHTAVFQMGENSQSLYFFDGSLPAGRQCNPIDLEKVQELIKQPKPNFTMNRKEAELAEEALRSKWKEGNQAFLDFMKRLKEYVENQPSGDT